MTTRISGNDGYKNSSELGVDTCTRINTQKKVSDIDFKVCFAELRAMDGEAIVSAQFFEWVEAALVGLKRKPVSFTHFDTIPDDPDKWPPGLANKLYKMGVSTYAIIEPTFSGILWFREDSRHLALFLLDFQSNTDGKIDKLVDKYAKPILDKINVFEQMDGMTGFRQLIRDAVQGIIFGYPDHKIKNYMAGTALMFKDPEEFVEVLHKEVGGNKKKILKSLDDYYSWYVDAAWNIATDMINSLS